MENKYYQKFCTYITNETFINSIHNIRQAVSAIWTEDVRIVHDYTDHGLEHSERIFAKLHGLLAPENAFDSLQENELYVLIIGVMLHDIGMQCDVKKHPQIMDAAVKNFGAKFDTEFASGTANAYSKKEQNEIRKNHHLLTAAWLDCGFKGKSGFPNHALQSIDSQYREDLINVCRFHSKLDITDCPERSRISRIRCQFLAALLRLGDELDIDKYRVNLQTVETFNFDPENSIYWYVHHHTQILIENHVITLKIYLAREDYTVCNEILQDTVINKFKSKNAKQIEILIKNGVKAVISDNSSVEIDEYTNPLPASIRNQLVKTGNTAKKGDTAQFDAPNADSREKAFEDRLLSICSKIAYLLRKADIKEDALYRARELFCDLQIRREMRNALRDEDISVAKKALSFIQGLSAEEMAFLHDIGVRLHVQVLQGMAQREAQTLFAALSGNEQTDIPLISDFWDYPFEQVWRVLDDCISIIGFNFESIALSEGYVYKKISGKLLAVSVSGETDKVFVWNLDTGAREPVAVLGGLYESVRELKILRNKGRTYVVGAGQRQIYIWDLALKSQPICILKRAGGISGYTIVRSVNEKLYVLGKAHQCIYIWDFHKAGDPIKYINAVYDSGDIFVVNTRLAPTGVSYALIGHSSGASNINNMIWEIKEESAMNFVITPLFDEKKLIEAALDTDLPDYTIDSYRILPHRKVLGVLARDSLLLYNVEDRQQLALVRQEGQHMMNFDMLETNGQIHVLVYYLWIERKDDGKGLVRCFSIKNGRAADTKQWFRSQNDIAHGVITLHNDKIKIFFNEHLNGTIYMTTYNQYNHSEFYKLPETMKIVDMACG